MLQLEHYFFPAISLEANPDYNGKLSYDESKIKVKVSTGVHEESSQTYMVMLNVDYEFDGDISAPYSFSVLAVGHFTVIDVDDEKLRDHTAATNGASILYASVRELIATMTSRSAFGTFFLPTRYFKAEDFLHVEPEPTSPNGE